MRLTDHTDYSLRVLIHLNQHRGLVTLKELAKELGISKNNLIKVSNQLAKYELIETSRGRTGGLKIYDSTGNLSLKDIVLKTEESFYMASCFSGKDKTCSYLKGCVLKLSLTEALDAFLESLSKQTLNDVTPKKNLTKNRCVK